MFISLFEFREKKKKIISLKSHTFLFFTLPL